VPDSGPAPSSGSGWVPDQDQSQGNPGDNTPWYNEISSGVNESLAQGAQAILVNPINEIAHRLGYPNVNINLPQAAEDTGMVSPPGSGIIHQALRAGGAAIPETMAIAGGAEAAVPEMEAADAAGIPAQTTGQMIRRGIGTMAPRSASGLAGYGEAGFSSGVGGVAGGRIARDTARTMAGDQGEHPDATAAGEMIGSMALGGMLPVTPGSAAMFAIKPIMKGGGLINKLYGAVNDSDAFATGVVARILKPAMTTNTVENLRNANETVDQIPGFNPSIAERTGNQGLVNQQEALQRRASGVQLNRLTERRQLNEQAVRQFHENAAPTGGPITAVFDTVSKKLASFSQDLRNTAAYIASGLPKVAAEKVGGTLKQRYDALQADAKAQLGAPFNDLRLNQTDLSEYAHEYLQGTMDELHPSSPIPGVERPGAAQRSDPPVIAEMNRDLQTLTKQLEGSSEPGDTVTDAATGETRALDSGEAKKPVAWSLSDFMTLRTRLGDAWAKAMQGANPDPETGKQLAIAMERMDNMLDRLPLGQEYQSARAAWKTGYVERFEKGGAFKMKQKDGHSFLITSPEKMAGLFNDGTYSSAMQFKNTFQTDPAAMQAYKSSVLDNYRQAVVGKDGFINPDAARDWLEKNRGMLEVFPELRATPQDLMERQLELNARLQEHEDQVLHQTMSKLVGNAPGGAGTITDEQFIQRAIQNPKLARQLVDNLQNDPDGMNALRRAVFQNAPLNQSLDDYLNSALAKMSLSPQHIRDLRTIFNAQNMLARVVPPKGSAMNISALGAVEDKTGFKVPSALMRGYSYFSRRVPRIWLAGEAAARLVNRLGMEKSSLLLENAFYDPALAHNIVTHLKVAGAKSFDPAIYFQPWFLAYGATSPQRQRAEAPPQ
jgi:hypothetical protein